MRPEDAAQAILNMNWDLSLPVNPVEIATKLGLQVFYSSDLDGLGGYYNQKEKAIFVNEDDPITRQRFSIAHELGHAVMGHGSSPRRNDVIYHKGHYYHHENEANRFAAALLMPFDAVSALVERGNMQLEALSKAFDVSPQAMTIRLQGLGYI